MQTRALRLFLLWFQYFEGGTQSGVSDLIWPSSLCHSSQVVCLGGSARARSRSKNAEPQRSALKRKFRVDSEKLGESNAIPNSNSPDDSNALCVSLCLLGFAEAICAARLSNGC